MVRSSSKSNGLVSGKRGRDENDKKARASPWTYHLRAYVMLWSMHILVPVLDHWWSSGPGAGAYDARPLAELDIRWLAPLCTITASILTVGDVVSRFGLSRSINCAATAGWWLLLLPATVAHALDLAIRFGRMPVLWDHEYWAMLTEIGFLVTFAMPVLLWRNPLLPGATSGAPPGETAAARYEEFLRVARLQFGVLYASAAFWKLTSSFFDPSYSCATLLVLELVGAYWPSSASEARSSPFVRRIVSGIAAAAPPLSFLGEATIGCGMLLFAVSGRGDRCDDSMRRPGTLRLCYRCRDVAIFLALLLHTVVFHLPVNTAGGFSLECMSRLVVFFEYDQIFWLFKEGATGLYMHGAIAAVCAALLGRWRQRMTGLPMDLGFLCNVFLAALYLGMIARSACATWQRSHATTCRSSSPGMKEENGSLSRTGSKSEVCKSPTRGASTWTNRFLVAMTIVYAFLLPIFNLQHMGASTMYSNLRYYNGSNHYVLRALARFFPPQPTSAVTSTLDMDRTLLHVERSSCEALNQYGLGLVPSAKLFPGPAVELVRREREIRWGDDLRQSPEEAILQLFPYCMRIDHSREILEPLFEEVASSEKFLPFALPAREVRRLLREEVADSASVSNPCEVELSLGANSISGQKKELILIRHRGERGMDCKFLAGRAEQPCTANTSNIMRIMSQTDDSPRSWREVIARKLLMPYPQLVSSIGDGGEELCIT